MVCGRPVTVALFLMYHSGLPVEGAQVLKPSGALKLRMCILPCDSLCVMAGEVWLVLSRSRPSTHFLPGGHSDSRVKFLWYPQISAAWKCQFSGISPLSFDTLVSVVTPVRPCWPFVHLDFTPSPSTHKQTHTHEHSKTHNVLYWYPASHLNRKFFRVTDCVLVFSLIWPYVSTVLTFINEVSTAAHICHYNPSSEMHQALI